MKYSIECEREEDGRWFLRRKPFEYSPYFSGSVGRSSANPARATEL